MEILMTIWNFITSVTLNDVTMQLIIAFIVIDFLTGNARAIKEVQDGRKVGKNFKEVGLNSSIALNGLIRHGLVIIIAYVVAYFSQAMGTAAASTTFNMAFSVSYLISIAENWSLAGYKTPKIISKYITKAAEQYGDISEEELEEQWEEIARLMEEDNNGE